jgi:hypothetical protein
LQLADGRREKALAVGKATALGDVVAFFIRIIQAELRRLLSFARGVDCRRAHLASGTAACRRSNGRKSSRAAAIAVGVVKTG